jgi:hypothetical protein
MQEQWCEEERKGGLVQVTQRKRKGEKKGRFGAGNTKKEKGREEREVWCR